MFLQIGGHYILFLGKAILEMDSKIFFSIIVPVYNAENYLKRCVDSILCQEYSDFELILVNDGSTDRSASVCHEYEKTDKRVITIDKENGGVVSARQAAADIVRGTHIVCVDADDWLDSKYLLESSKYIEEYNPDIITYGYLIEDCIGCNKVISYQERFYNKQQLIKEVYPKLIYSTNGEMFPQSLWGKVFRSRLFKEKHRGLDKRIKIGEDAACTIACVISAETMYISSLHLYHYYINPTSATNSNKVFPTDGPRLIHQYLEMEINNDNNGFDQQNNRRTVHALFNVCKSICRATKKYNLARKQVREIALNSFYYRIIKETRYIKDIKYNIMLFAMKHRIYLLIWIYSKLK